MKLSEAIRMNGMMKPQGFGGDSIVSVDAPCALGGALQSVGMQPADRDYGFGAVEAAWPYSADLRYIFLCPTCGEAAFLAPSVIRNLIWHLNDQHKWTRSQIADWVETVEPDQEHSPCVGLGTPSELATENDRVEEKVL